MKETAKKYLKLGLNPVPVKRGSKIPFREGWTDIISEEEIDQHNWAEIGICTGYASGNLEALDWDTKNLKKSEIEEVFHNFYSHIGEELAKKLVVQKTPSGGYHMLYRCPQGIESNQKLAKNREGFAIIETRGIGGYIKCYPSRGYEIIRGSFDSIKSLTKEERYALIIASRMQNRLIVEDNENRTSIEERGFTTKFPEYGEDPQIGIDLIENAGWKRHSENGLWINYTRPGKTLEDGLSAGYNLEGNFFYVFTTSQDTFTIERPYSNFQILAALNFNNNYKKCAKYLFDEGYGNEEVEEDFTIDFLSDETKENTQLEQTLKGEIQMGLSTGWPLLDEYFRLKPNTVNAGIGFDNVGKSVFMANIMTASSLLHGWKWCVIAPENKTFKTRQRIIESISGLTLREFRKHPTLYKKCLAFSRSRFKIVANDSHYSLTEAIERAKRVYEYYGTHAVLLDPWNFFKVEGHQYSYNDRVLSELRVFAENYCSVYIMMHPYSEATRSKKDSQGYLMAPTKYDAQGGANFAYRVDDFFSIHRIVNHPGEEIRKEMQFKSEKIKEWDTGGKPHDKDDYTILKYERRHGFLGYWDEDGNNPMYEYKQASKRR